MAVALRVVGDHRLQLERIAVGVIVATAIVTRFARLDLMEFKGDEAEACRLALHVLGYSEPGVGRFFPTAGLTSSIGIPNPPLFVYLVAVPLAIVRSPFAAVSLVAAANVVAVWLTYVVGKRCFSPFVGLAGAILYALSPWGIVFARKIWAQDLLPALTTVFVLLLCELLVRKRPSAVFGLIVVVAAATQLHFSGWVLLPILIAALVLGREQVESFWLGLGVAAAAAAYAPFLIGHASAVYRVAIHHSVHRHVAPDVLARFEAAVRFTFALTGGNRLSTLLGSQPGLAAPLSWVLGPAALLGLVAAAVRARPDGHRRLRVLVAAWSVLPLLLLTALPLRDYIHYYIVVLPLPFLGIGYLLAELAERRPEIAALTLAAVVICFISLDFQVFRTVIHQGGAPGDYGIAYRYKREAVAAMLRENHDRSFAIGTATGFTATRRLRDIRFLIWNSDPEAAIDTDATQTGYLVVNRFHRPTSLPASGSTPSIYRREVFGPLELLVVPLEGGRLGTALRRRGPSSLGIERKRSELSRFKACHMQVGPAP